MSARKELISEARQLVASWEHQEWWDRDSLGMVIRLADALEAAPEKVEVAEDTAGFYFPFEPDPIVKIKLEYRVSPDSDDWLVANENAEAWVISGAMRENERLGWKKYREAHPDVKPQPPVAKVGVIVGPYPDEPITCDCGRKITLYYNSGELDYRKCECGIVWYGRHEYTVLVKEMPASRADDDAIRGLSDLLRSFYARENGLSDPGAEDLVRRNQAAIVVRALSAEQKQQIAMSIYGPPETRTIAGSNDEDVQDFLTWMDKNL